MKKITKQNFSSLLYQEEGYLTRDLILTPGRFGLGLVPKRLTPDHITTVICGYCSTGCGLDIHIKNGKPVNLTPSKSYPVNLGYACPKGWEALTPLKSKDRASTPYIRNSLGKLESVSWDRALNIFCEKFKGIKEKYGEESAAFLSTGQMPVEEMLLAGSLWKFGMGFIHADGNTRQCMASAHVAYKESFGFDAPPFTYKDFEESDVMIFIGSNICIAHPIMWERVTKNLNNPKILVIDPRKTETASAADKHYAVLPGSDLTLLYGLANILIETDCIDHDFIQSHTTGFEQFQEFVKEFNSNMVSKTTGLSLSEIKELAKYISTGKNVSFWWTMGVNQSHQGTRTAQAIINLSLMTGNIGRPGTGPNSITGQVNAMGSRLFSNQTSLPGGRDLQNPKHRQDVADILGININSIPLKNSLPYDGIIKAVKEGKIKGLWIIATNPNHSWINQKEFKKLREKLEFLVVQDIYHNTETAQMADLILPAAGWGEKEGIVINSERRIGLFKKVAKAPGEALSDFYIFKLIAKYWGLDKMFEKWENPEKVFQLIKELSRSRPCDITGISDYKMIDKRGGIQWPFTAKADLSNNEQRLFENKEFYFSNKKAKFIAEPPRPLPELPDSKYPFILLTGRGTSAQWHTNTRTAKSEILKKLYSKNCYVEIHPDDAKKMGITSYEWVTVSSRRCSILAIAFIASTVQKGHLFIPMHYPDLNKLTFSSFDPYSHQPAYKASAVRISHRFSLEV